MISQQSEKQVMKITVTLCHTYTFLLVSVHYKRWPDDF